MSHPTWLANHESANSERSRRAAITFARGWAAKVPGVANPVRPSHGCGRSHRGRGGDRRGKSPRPSSHPNPGPTTRPGTSDTPGRMRVALERRPRHRHQPDPGPRRRRIVAAKRGRVFTIGIFAHPSGVQNYRHQRFFLAVSCRFARSANGVIAAPCRIVGRVRLFKSALSADRYPTSWDTAGRNDWSAMTTVIARPIKSTMIARPIKSTMIVGSKRAPVIVATPPIPVIAPARVPKVSWAPLRERPGLGLSVSCNAQPCQPQAGDQCKSRCSQTQIIFHRLTMYPCNPYRNIDARVSSWQSPANSPPRSELRGFGCQNHPGWPYGAFLIDRYTTWNATSRNLTVAIDKTRLPRLTGPRRVARACQSRWSMGIPTAA